VIAPLGVKDDLGGAWIGQAAVVRNLRGLRGCPALNDGCDCKVPISPGTGDGSFLRSGMWPMVGYVNGRVAADTLDTHTYPTLFEIVQADGLTDPLTHSATIFDQAFVKAEGPVFMQVRVLPPIPACA